MVKGNKQTFLKRIGKALRGRLIQITAASGSINWKLPSTFLEKSNLEPTAEEWPQKHVQGARVGESEPAARGVEIHQVLATYINHLVRTRRGTDLEVFDASMKGAGDEAREF